LAKWKIATGRTEKDSWSPATSQKPKTPLANAAFRIRDFGAKPNSAVDNDSFLRWVMLNRWRSVVFGKYKINACFIFIWSDINGG
jgi:hypothetical protein